MKHFKIWLLPKVFISILLVLLLSNILFSGEKEEILERIEELGNEAEKTTDINRLMEIQQEMKQLTQELMNQQGYGLGDISLVPGSTPEEEIDREYKMINAAYRAFRQTIGYKSSSQTEKIGVQQAIKVKGYIIVDGKDETEPYRGWIWVTLRYKVKEEFVGNIIVNNYYNLKSRKFTGEKDYSIHTISKKIDVKSVSGRECVEASAGIPGSCIKWEHFSTYTIAKGDKYPGMHQDVIMGYSEDGKMKIEVHSPEIVFKSSNGRIGRGLGCFGTDFEMSTSKFEQIIERGQLKMTKGVEAKEGGSPGCDKGSSITLYMEMETPRCSIELVGDKTSVFDCVVDGGLGDNITLEGKLREGSPVSYKWRIVSGSDIVRFEENEPNTKKVVLIPISYSRIPEDVIVEVEIVDSKAKICVASYQLTVQKPSFLRRLSDAEIEALGIKPYINYKTLCDQGQCDSSEIGNPKVELIDGYKRIVMFQVMDQFGLPIKKAMYFNEKRWVIINGNRINIPSEEESNGQGQEVPINPNDPNSPKITMFSGNGTTRNDGKVIDDLAIAYPKGSSGVPQGLDISIYQDIYIFDCFVGNVLQHYKEKDATSTYTAP